MKIYALKWVPLLSIPLAAAACGGKATESAAPAPSGAEAQERPGGPGAREEEETSYADVIEGAESDEGLFTIHHKDEDYLFEIPDSLLGRDMHAPILRKRAPRHRHGSDDDPSVGRGRVFRPEVVARRRT